MKISLYLFGVFDTKEQMITELQSVIREIEIQDVDRCPNGGGDGIDWQVDKTNAENPYDFIREFNKDTKGL